MDDKSKSTWQGIREEVETSGSHLLKEIHRLIAEGNVRKIIVKSHDGYVYLTVPLTAGAVAGGLVTLGAPWLTVLAAIAGLVADVKIEVLRETPPPDQAFTKVDTPAPVPPETQH